ncbi:histone-binding protein N1/N2 isoform X2 [Hyalella azteca]|uniref:Histone-binding protein N1/N2 isoform X2 n=1 Tax=Hyalella azteca TaxID=294128 RepID=A0A8B7NL58_HYAAZ|nr:histone-binding protein N1/N2 isoform X2 [Hyalella azteca]
MVAAPETKACSDVVMNKEEVLQDPPSAEELKSKAAEVEKLEAGVEKSEPSQASGSKDVTDAENTAKLEKAALKFAEGKRALIQNQNQLAVDAFAEACALQSAVHGDMSATMCEFYYYYGRALLDLARIEGDVLGNALAGVPEGEDMENSQVEDPEKLTEEERDTVAQQVDEALEENFKKNEGIKDDDTMETEDDVESKDNEEKTENGEEKDAQNEAVEDGDKTKGADDQAESSDVKKAENGEDKKAENAEDKKTENEDEEATETENAKEKTDEDSKTKNGEEKVSNEDAKPKSKSDDVKKSANGAATDLSEEKADKDEEEGDDMEAEAAEDDNAAEEDDTAEGDAAADGDEAADEDTQESEEDVPSLQLAWEVLELAKTIYEKNANLSEEENTKLSQVYLKLGEVSLENENYPESINMYSACLKIQESILEADDRWLAETHYQLGLAHSLADNFDVAVEHLQSAISVIEARIKNVSQKLEKDNIKISDDLETSSLSSEQKLMVSDVRELQKLLPELQEKMTDIKDTKASFTEKLKAMKAHFSGQLSGGSDRKSAFEEGTSSFSEDAEKKDAKPISNMLIRKKRKPEEEAAAPAEDIKKPRTEGDANGTDAPLEKKDDKIAADPKAEEKMDVQPSDDKMES